MKNTKIPKFTYVIPFRYKPDRVLALRRVVELINGFKGSEVLIVEQDKHSKISHLNLRANHMFIKSELPFNKSWALNYALKRVISPVIVCGDADFIMNPNDLSQALNLISEYDCVIPTSKNVELNQQESLSNINMILQIQRGGENESMTDGISIYKKQSLLDICGWNEDFIGYGKENEFQDMKIKTFLNYKRLEYTGYRLYTQKDKVDTKLLARNNKIMEHYKGANEEMLRNHMRNVAPKIGQKNKYSLFN